MLFLSRKEGGGFGNADGHAWRVSALGLGRPAECCTSEQASSQALLLYLLGLANPKVERIWGITLEDSQSTLD